MSRIFKVGHVSLLHLDFSEDRGCSLRGRDTEHRSHGKLVEGVARDLSLVGAQIWRADGISSGLMASVACAQWKVRSQPSSTMCSEK